jgi:5'-nucleotidase
MKDQPSNIDAVSLPLVVGVTTRAMFDLPEEHSVFQREGVEAYAKLQLERENDPLKPGAAFEVTRRLLALNPVAGPPLVDVILLSKNSPDLSLRAFRAIEAHQIAIKRGSFTSG